MKIFAIVVTYNGMKWIQDCLNSLLNSSIPTEIIVVDNCSKDGTVEFIKSNYLQITLFEQKENLGFGKANNIGMSYALKENADFVFLLNQDAFVNKNTIENLILTARSKPEYGILSPIQLDYSGKLLETYFYRFMSEDATRTFYSDFVLSNEIKKVYDINFIQAAAWLLPKQTLINIGGFDPVFFHYGEDDNYCHRVLYHKFKVGVVTNTFIRHDSKIKLNSIVKPFSVEYYKEYGLSLLVKYCNINIDFTSLQIRKEKKKIYKSIVISLFRFNFSSCFGFYKKLRFLDEIIVVVDKSRKINKQFKSNYLYD